MKEGNNMRLHLLDYGALTADLGWVIEASGVSTCSQSKPDSKTREFQMIGALIEHPKHGVILYELGPAPNYKELWPDPVKEVFYISRYSDENRLDSQIKNLGYDISDITAAIIGHMHLDHAGGLEYFRNTEIPIYVHEKELKYAFYAIATKQDFGAYIPHYIDSHFNWKPIHEQEIELFDNIRLFLTPGHTPGTLSMLVSMQHNNFLFTSDTMFFKENYYDEKPPGWLVRDMGGWWKSLAKLKSIAGNNNAHVILGHDAEIFNEYYSKGYFE